MARPIDYSKWKDIEISDDEDDTHPNIDTPSLFRWRHQARVEKQQEFEQRKKTVLTEKEKAAKEYEELQSKLKSNPAPDVDVSTLKKSLEEIERKKKELEEKAKEVEKEEKLKPWNVDTISSDGFSKTIVNKQLPREKKDMTDDEKENYMKEFVKKHEDKIKHYGWLSKFEDSKQYVMENNFLACEETANYLVIQCINLAMEEKFEAMKQVSHQVIAMQFLLELSKQLDIDPRACVSSFFSKIEHADAEYKRAFNDELEAFRERIKKRAAEKVAEQIKELEEEERKERIGPGGLDPVEVFESLPKALQECFESQDIGKLQQIIREMPEEEARYHMKRCVDSGLWQPAKDDPGTNPEDGFRKKDEEDEEGEPEEPLYEECKEK